MSFMTAAIAIGGNFDVNNGRAARAGAGAIDGDRWRFELEEEITSPAPSFLPPLPPSLPPLGSLILGPTAIHARSGGWRGGRRGGARAIYRIWSGYIQPWSQTFFSLEELIFDQKEDIMSNFAITIEEDKPGSGSTFVAFWLSFSS